MTHPVRTHLVRTRVDLRALNVFAAHHRKLDDDLGYALHLALRRRFGAHAPQPFRLMDLDGTPSGRVRLLGYCADPSALVMPPGVPDPDADWSEHPALSEVFPEPFEAKAMPVEWRADTTLRFEVRLRPFVRLKTGIEAPADRSGSRAHGFRAGTELDAFLAEALRNPERGALEQAGRTREAVYAEWLAARLGDAATLREATMTTFRRSTVIRGGRRNEGPEAVMSGGLTIRNGPAFADLVARGIGRHRAFGFGMLLLRPGNGA